LIDFTKNCDDLYYSIYYPFFDKTTKKDLIYFFSLHLTPAPLLMARGKKDIVVIVDSIDVLSPLFKERGRGEVSTHR
jgi:hypothetical protein